MAQRRKKYLKSNLLNRWFGKAGEKRDANFQRLVRLARNNGFQVYRSNLLWPYDKQFVEAKSANIQGIPDDRSYTLLEFARKTRDVPGDIAECGVRFGRSSYFIQTGAQPSDKHMYIFDSFEGLSAPGAADAMGGEGSYWTRGDLSVPETIVQENLKSFPNIHLLKGWIPERFADVQDRTFSFVHIDVDLYEPTLDSLKFFFPRMAKGGIIICDDYGFENCPGATRAFDEFFADKKNLMIMLATGQCVAFC